MDKIILWRIKLNTIEDIITLLMRRDRISREEAEYLVDQCKEELNMIALVSNSFLAYDEAADCVASWLGLEPDYIDIIMN